MRGTAVDRERTPRQGYILGIDGVRALSIGLVLFCHSVIFDSFTSLRDVGVRAGFIGVDVFFVLSGYLITTLLVREEAQTGDISLKLFYIRRSLRLFPALWLYLLVIAAIWTTGILPHHPWHSFVTSLLYCRNLVGRGHETDHLWSLSLEEQFYVIWPLLFVALKLRNRARLMLAISGICAVTFWRVYATKYNLAAFGPLLIRSDFRFDAPLFGCALALALHIWPARFRWTNSTGFRSGLLAIGGVAALAVLIVFGLEKYIYPGINATFISLLALLLIMSQIGEPGRFSRWLAWKPLVMIGRGSYSLYLWQELFLGPRIPGFTTIRTFPLSIVLACIAAAASYFCLERPLLRLKDAKFHKPAPHSTIK